MKSNVCERTDSTTRDQPGGRSRCTRRIASIVLKLRLPPSLAPVLLATACLADPGGESSLVPSTISSLVVVRSGRTNITLLGATAVSGTRAWAAGQAGVMLAWNGIDWR